MTASTVKKSSTNQQVDETGNSDFFKMEEYFLFCWKAEKHQVRIGDENAITRICDTEARTRSVDVRRWIFSILRMRCDHQPRYFRAVDHPLTLRRGNKAMT